MPDGIRIVAWLCGGSGRLTNLWYTRCGLRWWCYSIEYMWIIKAVHINVVVIVTEMTESCFPFDSLYSWLELGCFVHSYTYLSFIKLGWFTNTIVNTVITQSSTSSSSSIIAQHLRYFQTTSSSLVVHHQMPNPRLINEQVPFGCEFAYDYHTTK